MSATRHQSEGSVEEHVKTIRAWQAHLRARRSPADVLADWVARTVGRGPVIGGHVLWFVIWIAINQGWLGVAPFDPYPYPFLTLAVSLEAIFLALFVLASQNRMSEMADKRTHLDLQIDLLAEREMTAVLQMMCAISGRLDVPTNLSEQEMRDFTRPTDLAELARRLDTLDSN